MLGMTPEDLEQEADLWLVNLPAVQVLQAMGTQWRHGMGGPTGLDYSVLPSVMALLEIDPAQQREVFRDLRILENEALATMAEE